MRSADTVSGEVGMNFTFFVENAKMIPFFLIAVHSFIHDKIQSLKLTLGLSDHTLELNKT
jgi:hypothetical protein